ncbi:MAG: cisplatin damage response ATP-dependent DNA ligase [Hyphomicrobiaceae bacterium]
MQLFAELLDRLVLTPSRNRKIALLVAYFGVAPDPDRGWALAVLTDQVPVRISLRRVLLEIVGERVDPVLYKLSRDYIGDTAETVALLWPEGGVTESAPRLAEVVDAFQSVPRGGVNALLASALDRLDARGRWALLKLLGGAPRAGVSARLAKVALAEWGKRDVGEIEEIWHGVDAPFIPLFAWLEGRAERPDPGSKPMFRPVMLAHPIEESEWNGLNPEDLVAEWKWDGIRVQISAKGDDVRMFSRAGDDISAAFPEVCSAFAGMTCVVDGEMLVVREGVVAPFNDLQQRLNRKSVTAKMLRDYPAFVRLYDILFEGEDDLRALPFDARRMLLEAWHGRRVPRQSDVSPLIEFATFDELNALWGGARAEAIEGLMLKRRDSAYLAGRVKGQWYKWKRAALTLDCVLMYAQRGSGKRSSFYSDYTFGVWRVGADGARELVPVGKAYSGFTDGELKELDKWIRGHTVERFGPVLSVAPGIVLEIAFDAVHRSARHKSGVAMRFPRVHRIRWDKPADEADTLVTVEKLV